MWKIILVLLTFNAYSQVPDELKEFHQDLVNDINFLKSSSVIKNKSSEIVFKVIDETVFMKKNKVTAMCLKEFKMIVFSKKFILNANKFEIQQVFDHEFGHCVLNKEHNNKTFTYQGNKIPVSIMNDVIYETNNYYDRIIYESMGIVNPYKDPILKSKYRDELFR